jgi:hypothetical protein
LQFSNLRSYLFIVFDICGERQTMSVDFQLPLEPYLERNASWNPKRTVARLSIFDTPLNLIHPNPSGITIIQSEDSNAPPDVDSDSLRNGGLTCRACALAFNSVAEQRLHFKSSLHTTNLRRRLQGQQPAVTAAITDDVENLKLNDSKDSGENENDSGDSADEAGPAENDVVESEYSSVCAPTSGNGAEGEFSRSISGTEGPVLTFRPRHQGNWEFSCSEVLIKLPELLGPSDPSTTINPWSTLLNGMNFLKESSRMWAVLILRSGKFSAAIFDGKSVVLHKVFRRYTIRAKSGGSQSSYDSAHGKAASAGAMMRRAGEAMLKEDVSQLLRTWQAHLQTCFLILTSYPKTMKNVLFEENVRDPVLTKDDKRIRSVPFMVASPTFEECLKIRDRCSTIVFRRYLQESSIVSTATDILLVDEEEVKDMPAADVIAYNHKSSVLSASPSVSALSSVSSSSAASASDYYSPASSSSAAVAIAAEYIDDEKDIKEIEVVQAIPTAELLQLPDCPFSVRLFDAIDRDDVDGVTNLILEINRLVFVREALLSGDESVVLDCTGLEDIRDWELDDIVNMPRNVDDMETALHAAAARGSAGIVSVLLENGADPTRIDVRGRVPYMVSKEKPSRDAFRRARADAEDAWDWTAAGVPAALTADMEKAQREKEKEKKKRAKAKKKDQKTKEEEAKELAIKQLEDQEEAARQKEEEARSSAVSRAGCCASCGASLYHVQTVEVVAGDRCCNSTCAIRHKRKLAADAALDRIRQKKESS